jgi:hypothetical protein
MAGFSFFQVEMVVQPPVLLGTLWFRQVTQPTEMVRMPLLWQLLEMAPIRTVEPSKFMLELPLVQVPLGRSTSPQELLGLVPRVMVEGSLSPLGQHLAPTV